MRFSLPAMVNLNGTDYTDESRDNVTVDRDERATTVTLASGRIKKQIKFVGHNYTISWLNMPSSSASSIDGKAGRNELMALLEANPSITLTLTDGHNAPIVTDCIITSYSENPTLRRPGIMIWSCKLVLQEIGGLSTDTSSSGVSH